MKKLLVLLVLLAVIVVAGCSDNDEGDNKEEKDDNKEQATETNDDNNKRKDAEDKKVYQIGETATITSDLYDFPYEVTVNDFELTSKPINGIDLEQFGYTSEEGGQFAVINATIKNISDQPFVPNEMISAQLVSESIGLNSEDEDFFLERNEELNPGEEITGDLVYISSDFNKDNVLYLVYEYMASNEETKFELPVSS
ncbi:DUF4352 domain-containing protein [Agaribacter marinus]|uniref:DUF4352 domain-containing protein n=2 Tax=Virgibacillus salarius TaxID=447199 RepID=A0A941DWG3_9BACI|nr:DUF4352 domain-containing protein [Virgibacillus salarius]MBR7796394.1 DUF4352 domain-containing protein [Virgibacillus salarius]NAZ09103.1 DUF4352 domain-containing protein [Agaribacter marinus]